jgi:hypothetical protein
MLLSEVVRLTVESTFLVVDDDLLVAADDGERQLSIHGRVDFGHGFVVW